MISIELDSATWKVIDSLSRFERAWHLHMYEELPKELAKKAEEHFKPMLAVRPNHRGDLKDSIRHEIHHKGDGWEVNFFGLGYGILIDVGNFPADDVLFAAEYDHIAFPADKRLGEPFFTPFIHGMGHHTTGVPTHYSEKTVQWLAQGASMEVVYDHVMRFLSEVTR